MFTFYLQTIIIISGSIHFTPAATETADPTTGTNTATVLPQGMYMFINRFHTMLLL